MDCACIIVNFIFVLIYLFLETESSVIKQSASSEINQVQFNEKDCQYKAVVAALYRTFGPELIGSEKLFLKQILCDCFSCVDVSKVIDDVNKNKKFSFFMNDLSSDDDLNQLNEETGM